ncbi:MAG: NCS2 family permease [Fimbriimonadia bacterium]|jgi:AGZA family xanthine/uracil permease-like MFS transporter
MNAVLNRLFRLEEAGTTVRIEVLAGVTTFLTMAYIIFLQPAILSIDFNGNPTGLDFGAVLLATCLASALASIVMGLYARFPIALAPGMGENYFFVTVVMTLTAAGIVGAWQVALGIVFVAGVIFLGLSLFGVRERIIEGISPSMRHGIAGGIGLFIAFIGLRNGDVLVSKPGAWLGLNPHLASPKVAVFALGLAVAGILQARKVRGSILWGIAAAGVLALATGELTFAGQGLAAVVGFPSVESPAAFRLDIRNALTLFCLPFIIIFTLMALLDATGTLVAVAQQAGITTKEGKTPRIVQALVVDSGATVVGAALGTSTVTAYIESAAGVAYGGRTGLTAVVAGLLFLVALLFGPLIHAIGGYPPLTAPALVVVGVLMLQSARHIEWDDFSEALPAFLVLAGIPLCYSIADGLALGFVAYPIVRVASGKGRQVHWLMYVLALALLVYLLTVRERLS